jgi:endoribonuclease Dicer
VEQQSAYIQKHCRVDDGRPPTIQKLVGYDQAGWDQSDWDDCMEKNRMLLGTPALFQAAFVTEKRIHIGRFSLLVFDECHNAVGNSPMAAVLKDAVAPYQASGFDGPRILGLTASFVNGSLNNMEKKRRQLEALMLSTIFCPNVEPKTTDTNFHYIQWDKRFDDGDVREFIEKYVEEATCSIPVKDISKVVKRCTHVFDQLGRDAVLFYIDKGIEAQIKAKAKLFLDQGENATIRLSTAMVQYLPILKAVLASLTKRLRTDGRIQNVPPTTLKVDKLVQLLQNDFQNHGPEHRGIVFVEQVAVVSSLAKVLNDAFRGANIKCGAVSGTGHQSETDRQTQLNKFRNGEVRILAATAALEEGIDVTECAFVVRYTCIATTKAHIQGAGRARHPNATIYYFENNPHVERQKEASMIATAKNESLSLTKQEIQNAVISNITNLQYILFYCFGSIDSTRKNSLHVFF